MYFIGKLFSCSWTDGSTATRPFLGVHPGPAHVRGVPRTLTADTPSTCAGKPLFSCGALFGVEFRETGPHHLFRERPSMFFI